MDEDVVTELKKFISLTVSQQAELLDEKMNARIDTLGRKIDYRLNALDKRVDDLSSIVSDALDASNEITGARLKNHDRRIERLERKIT